MKLNQIIESNYDIEISSLVDDSREVTNGSLFFCVNGLNLDGHDFVSQAIANGAVAIVASKKIEVNIPVIYVSDVNKTMNEALNKWYDNVLDKLKLIAITGTDGKTTSTTLISQILDDCGLMGSNGVFYKDKKYPENAHHTTPLPVEMFKYLNILSQDGCKYVAMEVSSERILTGRMNGINYDATGLTNISKEHLNNHKTMENYVACKIKIFENAKSNGICVVNADDKYANEFINKSNAKVITYAIDNKALVYATDIVIEVDRLSFKLNGMLGEHEIKTNVSGRYNVYNLMLAIIVCNHFGISMDTIIQKLGKIKPVIGRSNFIDKGQPYKVIIDYAHTPNALKNLLEYVNTFTKGRVITVTGSAGGKDAEKRPDMGKHVLELSDYVIFTSDDPRDEDPDKIIDEMIDNSSNTNYEREVDRRTAIRKAIEMAEENDTVVIAGRGNDSVQPIKGKDIHFNDIEETNKILSE